MSSRNQRHACDSVTAGCALRALTPAIAVFLLVALLGFGDRRASVGTASASPATSAVAPAVRIGEPQRRPRSRAPRLRWAPPRLVNPITVTVTSPTRELRLAPGRDYKIRMPRAPVQPGPSGGLRIEGGRNVVLIGGELDFGSVANADEKSGRVAAIFNNSGTVHIEGLYAHGAGLVEGIQNYSENSIVQVENCRFDHLRGSESTHHSDLFQFGVGKELRIDRFTGSSNYQGIFVTDMTGHVYVDRTNIVGDPGAKYLFWQGDTSVPQTLSQFFVRPAPDRALANSVWPSIWDDDPSRRPFSRRDGVLMWGPPVRIAGVVRRGRPRGADFVPAGVPGVRYVSPGYRRARASAKSPNLSP